jgi:hypothetical protein
MLAVPCHPQVETLEAWPIVRVPSDAVVDWRAFYAGSAAQDVVRGIQAEIIAEPNLATAQAKMDVITAGAAKASAKTKSRALRLPPRPMLLRPLPPRPRPTLP